MTKNEKRDFWIALLLALYGAAAAFAFYRYADFDGVTALLVFFHLCVAMFGPLVLVMIGGGAKNESKP